MGRPLLKRGAQFGLLRMFVAFCPGFGTAVAVVGVRWATRFHPLPAIEALYTTPAGWGLMVAACLIQALAFGWFDAMLNPSLPKLDGAVRGPVLAASLALFMVGQIIIAPVTFGFTVFLLEILGIRI